eukprot:COSAG06_NODE_43293_length_373_cov_0.941606_1_plen_40_part_10
MRARTQHSVEPLHCWGGDESQQQATDDLKAMAESRVAVEA